MSFQEASMVAKTIINVWVSRFDVKVLDPGKQLTDH